MNPEIVKKAIEKLPSWLIATTLIIFIIVVLERLWIEQVPVKIFGIELNQKEEILQEIAIIEVGSILAYFGRKAPDGYLLCDGSTFRSQDAPMLFAHYLENFPELIQGENTAKLPNLSGRFLKGSFDFESVGEYQSASIGEHEHEYSRVTKVFSDREQNRTIRTENGPINLELSGRTPKLRTGESSHKDGNYGFFMETNLNITNSNLKGAGPVPENFAVSFIIKK
ncbi:MAG: phage tail protein [Opitutales bacterium]